ncbi:bifunctional phosphopantothenoylcysteine decarboxylase/phosphopantothenate--cysteine ligase CoaBC [Pacificimonas sp. WHA3]|uniref:Coenzyme A biosynthesis bifunctional protein CoaBC n=1 Tax=Pacificimonas pallii TaxID=2827236 RepID=A0ABS6SHL8_9SPHN|nr:bifunctional phosphopantothenoylcysteine decarboxylase/phosphopantothenate--cysteine ligase CoaBC [Pacificimonas pallii]MBV7257342.1 bifunctional phosphopantothenoylcysteine decarboxylase/phosphopantothenate--cysteine ligase CoaBC [Pacificimonas pallii]
MTGKRILLIISGGIAAYKSLELIRLLNREGVKVRAVMTDSAKSFVTPLSVGVLTKDRVFGDMLDATEEAEIGHIQLSRDADLIVVCPATANIMAKAAAGIADDLATTLLLATDKRVLFVPAMNVRMWAHPATQRNLQRLHDDGARIMRPDTGGMACGEWGEGRLPKPPEIAERIRGELAKSEGARPLPGGERPLTGRRALVTAGPTHEPIDPVRYIANRSSGRQGFAIAEALAGLGADVTLVAGPVTLPAPPNVTRIDVQTAREMHAAVEAALPADIAVMVAAVADYRAEAAAQKVKKKDGGMSSLALTENPDILAALGAHSRRPELLIGFAAETEKIVEHAQAKLARKGCDWIIANDVSGDVMGGGDNRVHLISADGVEDWPDMSKEDVARRLAGRIAERFS